MVHFCNNCTSRRFNALFAMLVTAHGPLSLLSEDPDAKYLKSFAVFDRDSTGLSLSQCFVVLNLHDPEPRTLEEVAEVFDIIDNNHDGIITSIEFQRLLQALQQRTEITKMLRSKGMGSMVAFTFFTLLFYPIAIWWARPGRCVRLLPVLRAACNQAFTNCACRDYSIEGRRARFVLTSFLMAIGLPFRWRQKIL
jgi:hypothetical protein